jgi:hypothetical protein
MHIGNGSDGTKGLCRLVVSAVWWEMVKLDHNFEEAHRTMLYWLDSTHDPATLVERLE